MNNSEIKKLSLQFRREYGIRETTVEALEDAFQRQGFTIVYFNPVLNDPDVTTVVENLGLNEMIRCSNGFLYVDANYRIVFVNEKLNNQERLYVLAHEEGHYYCRHTCCQNNVGRNVVEEQEANEFSHYLLQGTIKDRISKTVSRYKKPVVIGGIITGLVVGGGAASKEIHERQLYNGDYYVTAHGEKYHRKNCVTIEGHEIRRLTKEDIETGEYEPCSVCHPDEG